MRCHPNNIKTMAKTANSDEWYTPAWVTDPLGRFDLDPAAPTVPHRRIADNEYDITVDGLSQPWQGRVWCNPPFSHLSVERFAERMAAHGDGIMLIFAQGFDARWFQDCVLAAASAILFLRGRVRFIGPDGRPSGSPPKGTLLVAYGDGNAEILRRSGLPGVLYIPDRGKEAAA